jgi:hypothetical protein
MAMAGGPGRPQANLYLVWIHVAYVALSVGVTVWVSQRLFRNGRPFLVDAFRENERLADAFNRLLVTGVALINLGTVALTLRSGEKPANLHQAIEILSTQVGFALLAIGIV